MLLDLRKKCRASLNLLFSLDFLCLMTRRIFDCAQRKDENAQYRPNKLSSRASSTSHIGPDCVGLPPDTRSLVIWGWCLGNMCQDVVTRLRSVNDIVQNRL